MSTTLNFSFANRNGSVTDIHQIIERLHDKALQLPFKTVGEIVDLSGDEVTATHGPDDPIKTLLRKAQRDGKRLVRVIGFVAKLGDGEGAAAIALAMYSEGQTEWSWKSICQTWVSGTKTCGGIPNFLRCHLAVVALLDCASGLGIEVEVSGAADFGRKRDVTSLLAVLRQQISDSESIMDEMAGTASFPKIISLPASLKM